MINLRATLQGMSMQPHDKNTGITPTQTAWRESPPAQVPWQYRYIVARLMSATDNDAVRKARVSVPIVLRECEINPEFAALRQQAIDRTLTLDNEDSSQLARDGFPHLIQRALERAIDPDVRDRDQIAWARLAGDAAGAIGPGAHQGSTGGSPTSLTFIERYIDMRKTINRRDDAVIDLDGPT